jgi:predicted Zn finger-like uncharacterized protein
MIEIQCTSCQTRYRIDERILPEDTPTFKCSRCGHVFSAEPRPASPPRRTASAEGARDSAAAAKSSQGSATETAEPRPTAGATVADAPAPADAAPAEAQAEPRQEQPSAAAAPRSAQARAPRQRQAGGVGPRAAATAPPAPAPSAAEPARAAEPPAQAEEPAPLRRGTEELLQRRFRNIPDDESDNSGENLAFDFNDEPQTPDLTSPDYAREKWQVGDTDVPPPPPPQRAKSRIRVSDIEDDLDGDPGLNQNFGRARVRDPRLKPDEEQNFDRIRPEEISAQAHKLEADLRGRSYKLHSAGYFLGLFALVVLGFGIVTMAIQSAPIASAGLLSALPIVGEGLEPPISPARRVALGQVQSQYATLKGDQAALVISGTAENLTSSPLGAVRIEAALTASNQQPMRTQAVYCGNSLSSKMLDEMTPREIEFFEKLDAPKSFVLAPQASAPFVIVFVTPPAGAAHFQLRVVRADPAAAPAPATAGG